MREIKFRLWDGEVMGEIKYMKLPINDGGPIVMQYTGLKDKNGKEIYEGDIAKNQYGRICKVVWHEYTGRWDQEALNSEGHVKRYFQWGDWEVIVNIYENPELIIQ